MAQKYYTVKETALVFGIPEDEVKKMLERRELYGYRDGSDWKFKADDIERMAKERQSGTPTLEEDDSADVLLGDVEVGQSEIAASGTVIGRDGGESLPSESGIRLLDSGINLAEELKPAPAKDPVDSKVAQFEDLDLTLDEDVNLEDSVVGSGLSGASGSLSSDLDLAGSQKQKQDDLVLGGSGVGSDVTIGGDSGISLVDPADSGISLDTPSDRPADDSLALGEEDLLTVGGSVKTGILKRPKGDDEFLLTPLEDAGDTDESESGSQVIALDTEGDESATMISSGGRSRGAMLDEGLLSQSPLDLSPAAPVMTSAALAAEPRALTEGAVPQATSILPETPYSGLQIAALASCAVILMLCGIIAFDIMRNIWSWSGPYKINSPIMDWVLSLFES
jgi:excisionase family DNA binding protein